MILIISTCKEKLHELEFVKPIEKIVSNADGPDTKYIKKHYSEISKKDLHESSKIIICGTSLKDDKFLEDQISFNWITTLEKPILGICAGHQIISLISDDKTKIKNKTEIGITIQDFEKNFLNVFENDDTQMAVYHLHKNYTTLPKNFEEFTDSEIPQAIKHKTKPIYGVLFHPEVRNKSIIENFISM